VAHQQAALLRRTLSNAMSASHRRQRRSTATRASRRWDQHRQENLTAEVNELREDLLRRRHEVAVASEQIGAPAEQERLVEAFEAATAATTATAQRAAGLIAEVGQYEERRQEAGSELVLMEGRMRGARAAHAAARAKEQAGEAAAEGHRAVLRQEQRRKAGVEEELQVLTHRVRQEQQARENAEGRVAEAEATEERLLQGQTADGFLGRVSSMQRQLQVVQQALRRLREAQRGQGQSVTDTQQIVRDGASQQVAAVAETAPVSMVPRIEYSRPLPEPTPSPASDLRRGRPWRSAGARPGEPVSPLIQTSPVPLDPAALLSDASGEDSDVPSTPPSQLPTVRMAEPENEFEATTPRAGAR